MWRNDRCSASVQKEFKETEQLTEINHVSYQSVFQPQKNVSTCN